MSLAMHTWSFTISNMPLICPMSFLSLWSHFFPLALFQQATVKDYKKMATTFAATYSKGGIHSPILWTWAGHMMSFDQKNMAEVVCCQFWASTWRTSTCPLLGTDTFCKTTQANLLENERHMAQSSLSPITPAPASQPQNKELPWWPIVDTDGGVSPTKQPSSRKKPNCQLTV